MLHHRRLAIFIGAQHGRIETETGKIKIVRVTAKIRRCIFGCPHQPQIRKTMVAIQMVLATLIERHHVAANGGLLVPHAIGRELGKDGVLRSLICLTGQPFGSGVDVFGYIGNLFEPARLTSGALLFIFIFTREKTVEQIIFLRAGNLLKAAGNAMVVGHNQPLRRNKRRRAAAEIYRCAHHVVNPDFVRGKVIFCFQAVKRQVIKRPHAFFCERGKRQKRC